MSWPAILFGVAVLQIVLATLVWYDARRRSLEHGFKYWYGVMIPVAGFLVCVAYLHRRDQEPQRERTTPTVDQPDAGMAWRVRLPDPHGLPRRLYLALFALWRRILLFSVVLSAGLLVGALLVHPAVNAGVLELSGVLWVVIFSVAYSYRDAVYTVDTADGTLRTEYTGGLVGSGDSKESVVEFQSLDCVRAVPVGRHTVCRLAYDQPLFTLGPSAVIVPREQTEDVLDTFEQAGVDTQSVGRRGSLVWLATALVPVGLLPVVGTLATGEVGSRTIVFSAVSSSRGWQSRQSLESTA